MNTCHFVELANKNAEDNYSSMEEISSSRIIQTGKKHPGTGGGEKADTDNHCNCVSLSNLETRCFQKKPCPHRITLGNHTNSCFYLYH